MFHFLYNIDVDILLFIQEHLRNPIMTPIFKFITTLGNGGMIWLAVILGLLCYKNTRNVGIATLITLVACFIINNIILKNVIARPRPFEMLNQLQVLINKPTDFSFPSGHTANSFAVAGAIYLFGNKKWGIGAFILAGAIGFSRLYLGVHYPSDVICGGLVGIYTSLLVRRLIVYWQEKQKQKVLNT